MIHQTDGKLGLVETLTEHNSPAIVATKPVIVDKALPTDFSDFIASEDLSMMSYVKRDRYARTILGVGSRHFGCNIS